MKLTTAVVIAFSAASALSLAIPHKSTVDYAHDLYEHSAGEGISEPFSIHTRAKRDGQVYTGGYATYFFQKGIPGACGQVHSDNDPVVAMVATRYRSDLCGKQVKVTNPSNGKSVVAVIADRCPGCRNENSLDLSLGAFQSIADTNQGVVGINWAYV